MRLHVCFSAHEDPYEKKYTLEGKKLLPLGANSFLLELKPFQRREKTLNRVSPESIFNLKYEEFDWLKCNNCAIYTSLLPVLIGF